MVSIAALALAVSPAAAQEWGKPKPAVRNEPTAPAKSSIPKAVQAGPKLEWTESFVTASRQARQSDKIILAYFCGSDWCEWTKKLDKEVMTTPMFVNWAERNVIPLKVDYPSPDTRQSRATAKQNEILAASYNVAKVPTILFLDFDGEVIDRVGYDGACLRDDEKKGAPMLAMERFESIVAKRPTGQQMKEFTFVEATEITEKTGQPILILITNPTVKQAVDTRDLLLKSGKLARFVNTNMAFVNLSWPAETDTSPQAKWFKTFTDAWKIGPASIQLVMMTYGGRKVQHKITSVGQIDGIINQLATQLPRFDYNGTWLTDYRKAQSISAQTQRDILIAFTSFDSSEWCQKLDAEIFQQDAFKEYAKQNLVLVRCDYPQNTEQATELKQQNQSLAEAYNIRGYPSIVLINASMQKIGTAKYMPGGPEAFIKELNDLRQRDFDRRTLVSDQVEVKKK
jgi:thioredoxin-related protein